PVNFTQQQIKQLHEARKQDDIRQNAISIANTSYVFQAPDAIHFSVAVSYVKAHFMALGFKVDSNLSNVDPN
ncbi:34330_t:CDS:2, partial [Racocetra persica]